MRVDVSFRNLATSEPLRDYASEKVARLRRVLVKPIDAQVVLSRDGFRNIAEARVRDKGSTFTGSESSEDDMYAAIDLVMDKVERQARRYKERMKQKKGRSSHRDQPTVEDSADEYLD